MAKASRAGFDLDNLASVFVGRETDMIRKFDHLSLTDTQLAHTSLSPSVQRSIFDDSKGIERPSRNIVYIKDAVFVMEELDKRRRSWDLGLLQAPQAYGVLD